MTTIARDIETIGLIGFGAFGGLAAEHLGRNAEVIVHDPRTSDAAVLDAGARPVSIEDAAGADVIVLGVPIQAIPIVCATIAPFLREGTLVCDVGSVKLRPVEWMLSTLPRHAQVLGTHPLFGPQTVGELGGIAGEPIVLCRARVGDEMYGRVRAFLADRLGLRVVELTPDEHDQQMAVALGLTHIIGRAVCAMGLIDQPATTLAYRRLMQIKANTECDAPELCEAIQKLNPYAARAGRAFLEAVRELVEAAEEP